MSDFEQCLNSLLVNFLDQKANFGNINGGAIRPTCLLVNTLFVIIVFSWMELQQHYLPVYWIYKAVPSNSPYICPDVKYW